MASRTVTVFVEVTSVVEDDWCPACLRATVVTVEAAAISATGVSTCITSTCRECGWKT